MPRPLYSPVTNNETPEEREIRIQQFKKDFFEWFKINGEYFSLDYSRSVRVAYETKELVKHELDYLAYVTIHSVEDITRLYEAMGGMYNNTSQLYKVREIVLKSRSKPALEEFIWLFETLMKSKNLYKL